jgi:hypothetical protein
MTFDLAMIFFLFYHFYIYLHVYTLFGPPPPDNDFLCMIPKLQATEAKLDT